MKLELEAYFDSDMPGYDLDTIAKEDDLPSVRNSYHAQLDDLLGGHTSRCDDVNSDHGTKRKFSLHHRISQRKLSLKANPIIDKAQEIKALKDFTQVTNQLLNA